ncbi:THAP domain-containing protein 1-like [Acyrthosiphon pisum]|uniref:THAP-type domain-containing protein n=1 Tax=Acyrthosiphon pisum TaxID=7029 RepID=A0A8R2JTD2_ACYPI|nr:THAP domain-containing protein 1-like [Acyrthosiphon pisum]
MPVSCSVHGCTNRQIRGCSQHFFKFPLKDLNKLQLWIDAVKRKGFIPNNSSRVCSDHFLRSEFVVRPGGSYKLMLKGESVPSLLMSGKYQYDNYTFTPNLNPTILKSQESIDSVAIDLSITKTPPNVNLTPIKTPHYISPLLKTPSKCTQHPSTLTDYFDLNDVLVPHKKCLTFIAIGCK